MAILKIETITFLQDNPASFGTDFVSGDVVEIFFDTSLLTFSVKKNGSAYTGTSQISSNSFDITFDPLGIPGYGDTRVRTLITPNYCIGTTLYSFQQGTGFFHYDADFPYSSFIAIENANQCSLTPVNPDIHFVDNPVIVHASTASSFDGSISYQAESSYGPVNYILSVNGYYVLANNVNDATHNNTGVFTGLGVGHYQIIAIDHLGEYGTYATFDFEIVDLSLNHPPPPLAVCDLAFISAPSSMSQDTGSGNGAIDFPATSSNSIQYALRDFNYGDGYGQVSSSFTNLVYGQYILYVRDSKGCRIQIAFTIPLNSAPTSPVPSAPAYGILYSASWRDLNGVQAYVYIKQKGFTGSITEVVCAGEPMKYSLRIEGDDDKFTPIGASELILNLIAQTSGYFDELFTTNPDKYQIHYLKGGDLKWMGKLFPATRTKPYHENGGTAYPISIKATDGLVELDDVPFVDDGGNRFIGTSKEIVVVARALNKLKFGIGIRCAVNLYAEGMNTTDADDPLDQAYVNYLSYYRETEPLSCLEVIKRIIEPYGATIVQWEGYWWIIRREELVGDVDYREFNKNGAYVSNGTLSGGITIKNGVRFAKMDASEDTVLPKGYIEVDYSQGKVQLVPNSDFAPLNLPTGGQSIDLTGYAVSNAGDPYFQTGLSKVDDEQDNVGVRLSGTGMGFLQTQTRSALVMYPGDQLKIGLRYKVESFGGAFKYQKVKLLVQYGPYFLKTDGTWDVFTRTAGDGNKMVIYETDFGKFKDWEIKAPNFILATVSLSGASGTANILINGVAFSVTYSTSLTITAINFLNAEAANIYAAYGIIVNVDSGTLVFTKEDNSQLPPISIVNTSGTLNGTTTTADSSAGYVLTVSYFTSWILDAEFDSYVNLRTKKTVSIPAGTKSEIKLTDNILYYELENNTGAESTPQIVRPNDYNASTNPYQWILKQSNQHFAFGRSFSRAGTIVIDKVSQEYMPGGNELEDLLIINKAPKNSKQVLKKEIYHGSMRDTNYTLIQWGIDLGSGKAIFSGTQVGNPNAKLTFLNYLRDSSGNGWVNWTRDAVSELLPLEQILTNSYIAQYKDASRRITGSLTNNKETVPAYISPLSVLIDGENFFLPMGFSYMDKSNMFNGEFAQLVDITEGGTETDGGIKTGNETTNGTFG